MSRAQVRSQIATFISAANISTLNQVFTSFPKQINYQVNATAGQKSRAAAVVFIGNETESRVALGGAHAGWKRIDYTVYLQVFHHSMWNNSEQAMDDFDTLIDAIKDRLRSDHRFGDENGTIVWQGAEPEISVDYSEPSTADRGATDTWAGIRFQVTQMIPA